MSLARISTLGLRLPTFASARYFGEEAQKASLRLSTIHKLASVHENIPPFYNSTPRRKQRENDIYSANPRVFSSFAPQQIASMDYGASAARGCYNCESLAIDTLLCSVLLPL